MKQKSLAPHIMFSSFLVLVLGIFILSEIFHTPSKNQKNIIENILLFKQQDLSKLQTIILTNSNGSYQFDKSQTNDQSPWLLTSPTQSAANKALIESILSSLSNLKIKKNFPKSENNLENYSLKIPKVSLELINNLNTKTKLILGLQNTIDNSLFVTFDNGPEIFQIDNINIDFQKLELKDLVQNNVFEINKDLLSNIQIYSGPKRNDTLVVNIVKNPSELKGWRLSEKENANEDKIFSYIDKLNNLKPEEILDITNDLQRKKLIQLTSNPKLILTLEDANKNVITYTISNTFTDFPNLITKGETYFLVKISSQEKLFIFKKDVLSLFEIAKSDFLL